MELRSVDPLSGLSPIEGEQGTVRTPYGHPPGEWPRARTSPLVREIMLKSQRVDCGLRCERTALYLAHRYGRIRRQKSSGNVPRPRYGRNLRNPGAVRLHSEPPWLPG